MGKSIFTKIFGVFLICVFFANGNVWAGACGQNYYPDGTECKKCPNDYPWSDTGHSIYDCYILEPHSYDEEEDIVYYGKSASCTVGYYWPANSIECNEPCPEHYRCPGGTASRVGPSNFISDQIKISCGDKCASADHKSCVACSGGSSSGGSSSGGRPGNNSGNNQRCQANQYKDYLNSNGSCHNCPTPYPKSAGGTTGISGCYNDDSGTNVYWTSSGTTLSCTIGWYVPANSQTCASCKTGHLCPGGKFYGNVTYDQRSRLCIGTGNIPNVDHTECLSKAELFCDLNKYRDASGNCQKCPSDFPKADGHAIAKTHCYKDLSDRRVYYKKVSCGAGKYLPKASSECKACLDGHYCTADKYYPSLKDDQGLKTCESGKVPNSNKTACVNDNGNGSGGGTSGGILKCGAGQYVPAGLGRCQSCTGTKKYCPGGNYQYPKSVDQGILDCPENAIANTKHDGCYFNLSSTYLKNGPSGAKTKFGNQCWVKTNINSYAKCLFPNGVSLMTSDGILNNLEFAVAPVDEGPALD